MLGVRRVVSASHARGHPHATRTAGFQRPGRGDNGQMPCGKPESLTLLVLAQLHGQHARHDNFLLHPQQQINNRLRSGRLVFLSRQVRQQGQKCRASCTFARNAVAGHPIADVTGGHKRKDSLLFLWDQNSEIGTPVPCRHRSRN